ncbi:MAG: hypothetical protein ACYSPI_08840, partial [Planctomycetota bacterium]
RRDHFLFISIRLHPQAGELILGGFFYCVPVNDCGSRQSEVPDRCDRQRHPHEQGQAQDTQADDRLDPGDGAAFFGALPKPLPQPFHELIGEGADIDRDRENNEEYRSTAEDAGIAQTGAQIPVNRMIHRARDVLLIFLRIFISVRFDLCLYQ